MSDPVRLDGSDGTLGPVARLFASLPPHARRQLFAGVLALMQAIPPERRFATIRWVFKRLTAKERHELVRLLRGAAEPPTEANRRDADVS